MSTDIQLLVMVCIGMLAFGFLCFVFSAFLIVKKDDRVTKAFMDLTDTMKLLVNLQVEAIKLMLQKQTGTNQPAPKTEAVQKTHIDPIAGQENLKKRQPLKGSPEAKEQMARVRAAAAKKKEQQAVTATSGGGQ